MIEDGFNSIRKDMIKDIKVFKGKVYLILLLSCMAKSDGKGNLCIY